MNEHCFLVNRVEIQQTTWIELSIETLQLIPRAFCVSHFVSDVVEGFRNYLAATKACSRQGKAYAKNVSRTLQLLSKAMGCRIADLLKPSVPQK